MKVSIVVDRGLPIGLISNCAAVLGVSLGATYPDLIGPDVQDQSGMAHRGITGLPLPILSASPDKLRDLFVASQAESSVTTISFTDVAQGCKTYEDYQQKLSNTPFQSLQFLGILIVGPHSAVSRLTGSLPLLKSFTR